MHTYIFLLSTLVLCGFSYELDSLTGTPIEECINCICYAKTRRRDTQLCGRQLITLPYWGTARSLTTSPDWKPVYARRSCTANVNCILNAIKRYTEQLGEKDCDLDGELNCQHKFGVQIWKSLCVNRRIAPLFFDRFHSCLPNMINSDDQNQVVPNVNIELQQYVNGSNNHVEQHVILPS